SLCQHQRQRVLARSGRTGKNYGVRKSIPRQHIAQAMNRLGVSMKIRERHESTPSNSTTQTEGAPPLGSLQGWEFLMHAPRNLPAADDEYRQNRHRPACGHEFLGGSFSFRPTTSNTLPCVCAGVPRASTAITRSGSRAAIAK